MNLKQSTAAKIPFFMRDATDSTTGLTGLTCTVTISKDGAAFGSPGGSVTEIGNGWYYLSANTTDTGTTGALLLHATGTGADIWDEAHQINDFLAGDTYARVGAPVGASISADIAAVEANAVAIKAKTDNLPSVPASQGDVTTVGTAVATLSTKVGTPAGASVCADLAEIEAETDDIAAIKSKTDNLPSDPADQSLVIAATDAIVAILGTPLGISIAGDIAAIPIDPLLTGDTRLNHLDADISTRLATSGYTAPANSDITAIKGKTDNLPSSPAASAFKKNTALPGFQFQMFDTAGAPATGLTVVTKISKDGGSLATSSNAATELTLGWYTIDFTSGEMNAKNVALNFAAAGAITYGQVLTTEG